MSKQRLVDTRLWTDTYVRSLDVTGKLAWLYLLTNPCTNISGVYEMQLDDMAVAIGVPIDDIRATMARFERDGRCVYRNGWVALRNWIRYQSASQDVAKGIQRQLALAPAELVEYVVNGVEPEGVGTVYRPSIDHGTPNLTQPNLTQPSEDMSLPTAPTRQAKPKHSPEDIALHRELGAWFTEHGGHWSAGVKEAACLYRLIAWARKEEPEQSEEYLRAFLAGFGELRAGTARGLQAKDKDWWQGQPCTPSAVLGLAQRIKAVLVHIGDKYSSKLDARELAMLTEGL